AGSRSRTWRRGARDCPRRPQRARRSRRREGGGVRPARSATAIHPARSLERQPVDEAALVPQRIQSARHLERAARAEIAIENLAVIANRGDRAHRPVLRQSGIRPEAAGGAEDAPYVGIVGALRELAHIGLCDAELL